MHSDPKQISKDEVAAEQLKHKIVEVIDIASQDCSEGTVELDTINDMMYDAIGPLTPELRIFIEKIYHEVLG